MIKRNNPIFLTGSHRSGTTWAGRIIASSKSVGYVMEPFNDANNRPGIFRETFGHYFPYIDDQNGDRYLAAVKETIAFKYRLLPALKSIRNGRESARMIKDAVSSSWYRLVKKRPFIKDPNALFMSEWLYNRFDADIIVLIRHPAAFVSSLLLLKWYFPFSDIMKQKKLLRSHLACFKEEIQSFMNNKQALIDEAILAWRLLHHMILNYQRTYDDWIFVRHEDLSKSPESEFRKIFKKIDLDFDDRVKRKLQEFSGVQNPNDTTDIKIPLSSRKSIKRNSRSNIWNWKKRLDVEQIEYIRNRVEPLSSHFYNDNDW